MNRAHDVISGLREPTRGLWHATPEVWAVAGELPRVAVDDGARPARVKEFNVAS